MTDTFTKPDIIDLTPVTDPVTGQQVYADLSASGDVISCFPVPRPTTPDNPCEKVYEPTDPSAAPAGTPLSRLPEGRMAADHWAEIIATLERHERGERTPSDVSMLPGGALMLTTPTGDKQQSTLPTGRMAAVTVGPTAAEARVLRSLDPDGVEDWQLVGNELMSGWAFRLQPQFESRRYEFFAFRSPSDANLYRVAVLWPNMDREYGHRPHIISRVVGGEEVKVICGPAGAPARDLTEARMHAAKWTAYTSALRTGRNPGFSL